MSGQLDREFCADASLLPHMLDIPTDQILLSRLSEEDYRKASFLDQRIITPDLARETLPWEILAGIALPDVQSPSYIFHIGHVGSTLISRLLGTRPDVLALREPHILRSFSEISQIQHSSHSPWSPEKYEARLKMAVSWLSRAFHPSQRALIKASSFVSEIAPALMTPSTKAVFLQVSLSSYLATIFAGDGSRQEARQLAGLRMQRLDARLGTPVGHLWDLSEGQIIALGWITEMTSLISADRPQVLWMDFDTFLEDTPRNLHAAAQHLDISMTEQTAEELASGPIMRSYSKAPEFDYTPRLRHDLLVQARREHRAEITKAENWVSGLAGSHDLVSEALSHF